MKLGHCVAGAAAVVALVVSLGAQAGVSVRVGEPGFYGQLDIGNFPSPTVIHTEPVIIRQTPQGVNAAPVYVRVPPGHMKKWRKYCGRYNACERPVYFVQDNWYLDEYAPQYRAQPPEKKPHNDEGRGGPPPWANGHGNGHGRGHGRD